MDKDVATPRWMTWFAAVLLVASVACHVVWLSSNNMPPYEHSCRYIQESIVTGLRWSEGRLFEVNFYPDGGYLAAVAALAVGGVSWHLSQMSMLIYLPFLAGGAWWLGRRLGGPWGGLLATVACLANPWLTAFLHGFIMDVPLAVAVIWAYIFYVRSQGGTKPGAVCALGAVCAWGLLVKWSFAFFMLPLLVLLAVDVVREDWWNRLSLLGTCALAGLSVTVLAKSPELCEFSQRLAVTMWYDTHMYPVPLWPGLALALLWLFWAAGHLAIWKRRGWQKACSLAVAGGIVFFLAYWWYYLDANYLVEHSGSDLSQRQLNDNFLVLLAPLVSCLPLCSCFVLAGCWFYLRQRRTRAIFGLLGLGLAVPVGIYSVMNLPATMRYLFPASVFASTLAVGWLASWRYVRLGALGLLVVFWGANVGWPCGAWAECGDTEGLPRPWGTWWWGASYMEPPSPEGLPLSAMIDTIQANLEKSQESTVIGLVAPDSPCDVDVLISVANEAGHTLYVKRYDGTASEWPNQKYSLLYTNVVWRGELLEKFPFLAECEELCSCNLLDRGVWVLYRTPFGRTDEYRRLPYDWDVASPE